MSTMFLVKIPNGTGRKPLVTRIDPLEVVSIPDSLSGTFVRQRAPRAWWLKPPRMTRVIGIAAVAHTIEQAHQLIEELRTARDHLQVEERTT